MCLSTGDTMSILNLLEAAGDIFFNSNQERDKAITFYRVVTFVLLIMYSNLSRIGFVLRYMYLSYRIVLYLLRRRPTVSTPG